MKKRILFGIGFVGCFLLMRFVLAQTSPEADSLTAAVAPVTETAAKAGSLHQAEPLITVDFTEADIQSVLKVMALKGNVNIVTSPEVIGTVTIHLKDVTWTDAFESIIKTYGFAYEQNGNIYQVFSQAAGQKILAEIRSDAVTLEYASLEQVKGALEKVLSVQGKIESIAGTNQIILTDSAPNLKKARELIAQIDQKMPQVLIDAKIVETALGEGEAMGIDWNMVARFAGARRPTTFPFTANPAQGRAWDRQLKQARIYPDGQTQILNTTTTTATGATGTSQDVAFPAGKENGFPFTGNDDFSFGTFDFTQFTAVFSAVKNRKNTKIISNPRIVVLNNEPARVHVGGEVGIPTFERNETTGALEVSGFDPRNFGIVLNVIPHVTKNKEIRIVVTPEITNFKGFIPIGGTNLASPEFGTIEAKTDVMINSGDTLVIGGLIANGEDDARSKVPYLNRVPIAGWLFKSLTREPGQNRKTETIFFVTVTLVDDVYNREAVKKWRKTQQNYENFKKGTEEEFFTKRQQKEEDKKRKQAEKLEKKKAKELAKT